MGKVMNICTTGVYKKKDGSESKPSWPKVGALFINDKGKMTIKLDMFPQLWLHVFEQKDKSQPKQEEEY